MKEQSLITSTIILTITSFFTRTMGMISTVFLSHILGADGIGLYQLINSLYIACVIFASAGLSVSVSKLIAENLSKNNTKNINTIMHLTFCYSFFISMCVNVLLFTFSSKLSLYLIQDIRATTCLKILSFSLPFISCSSCFKGYFYATKKTIYPASAEVLEQVIKLALIIILIKFFAPLGNIKTYNMIGLGFTIGEICSWSYLAGLYFLEHRAPTKIQLTFENSMPLIVRFINILIPIALIAYLSCLFMSIENLLIPRGLKAFGESQEYSLSVYGILKGMVLPILFFPSAFLTAFSTTLMPEIARFHALGHKKRVISTTNRVLQLTLLLSFLAAGIFINYSDELGIVIYHNEEFGHILRILSIIVPFTYVEVIADGILKGLDEQVSCLKYNLYDSVIRIITIYFFIPIKGITSFMIIMIMSCIFTSTLNFNKLLHATGSKLNISDWLLKPTLCSMGANTFSRLLLNLIFRYQLTLTYKLILGIGFSIVFYILLLFIVKSFSQEDIAWIRRHIKTSVY